VASATKQHEQQKEQRLLGCLPELWNYNNQPSTTNYAFLRHDCFNAPTNIDLTEL